MKSINLKNKLLINEIVSPVSKELVKVDSELRKILDEYALASDPGIPRHILKNPDKRIRQAMILLPAKTIGKRASDTEIIRLCAAAEVIYSAANVHNGISDSETIPVKSLRNGVRISNSLAVLSGDNLYSLALLVISEIFPENMLVDIIRLIEKANYMKISDELRAVDSVPESSYLDSLKNRASVFTGTFAFLGAYVSNANADEAAALEKIGLNLGMAYQVISDGRSGKKALNGFDPGVLIKDFAGEAKKSISGFKDSIYKKSLLKLVDYFTGYYGIKAAIY